MLTNSARDLVSLQTNEFELDFDQIVTEACGLISPPEVCLKIYKLINSPNCSAKSIGDAITMDPNLTAKVLKIVNSAVYNFPSQILSIPHAITILGMANLCNLVMAIAAVRAASAFDNSYYNIQKFWNHSVFVALCSKHIALICKQNDPDSYFIAGLLHDIGLPIIYSSRKDLCESLLEQFSKDEQQLADYEKTNFGFDHASIGSAVLKSWALPEKLVTAIADHHSQYDNPTSAVLFLSELLSNLDIKYNSTEYYPDFLKHGAWDYLNVNTNKIDIENLLNHVTEEKDAVLNALF